MEKDLEMTDACVEAFRKNKGSVSLQDPRATLLLLFFTSWFTHVSLNFVTYPHPTEEEVITKEMKLRALKYLVQGHTVSK